MQLEDMVFLFLVLAGMGLVTSGYFFERSVIYRTHNYVSYTSIKINFIS